MFEEKSGLGMFAYFFETTFSNLTDTLTGESHAVANVIKTAFRASDAKTLNNNSSLPFVEDAGMDLVQVSAK